MRKFHRYTIVLLLVAGSVVAHAQSSLRGKWRGMDGNVPNIDLTVEQSAGRATGSAVFYMLKKDSGTALLVWRVRLPVLWRT
jgi:hypothetical protein